MKNTTPKHVILQLGSLIALYVSVVSLLVLIFSITNLQFPDDASYYWEDTGTRQAIRTSIAMLLVFFPAFLTFTRLSNQDRRKHLHGEYHIIAKWMVYLSILGGILILLGDLVTLINYFLNGEITIRFIIKVCALLSVIGLALGYYVLDVKGYFKKNTSHAFYFAIGATILVLGSLIYGYSYIESPAKVREINLDEKQLNDLQDMYWEIIDTYRSTLQLPKTLDELYINRKIPSAPDQREAYVYTPIDDKTFELCATFATPSPQYKKPTTDVQIVDTNILQNNNWEHGTGYVCFKRTVETNKTVPLPIP